MARDVDALVERVRSVVTRRECWSCACLQGFLAQMELDAARGAKRRARQHKIPPKEIHACLGCEPCPPATLFAAYLMCTPAQER